MALAGVLEFDIELDCSADTFFKLLSKQIHHVPNASDKIHAIDVHEGDWESAGSVKLWTYTIDGKQETFKEKVEVDEPSKTVTLVGLEGHVLEQYKSYKMSFKAIPKEKGCLVAVKVEYEKLKAGDSPPSNYLNFAVSVVKDVGAHLVKA